MRNKNRKKVRKEITQICRKIILKIIRWGLWGLLEEALF